VAGSSLGGGSDWQHGDPLAGDDFDFGWTGRLVVAGDEDRSRAAVTALARNSRRVQLEHHALASPTSWRSDEICCCRLPRTASQRERTPVPACAGNKQKPSRARACAPATRPPSRCAPRTRPQPDDHREGVGAPLEAVVPRACARAREERSAAFLGAAHQSISGLQRDGWACPSRASPRRRRGA
jgi:hypothetical protein